jgi:hypothetical protein
MGIREPLEKSFARKEDPSSETLMRDTVLRNGVVNGLAIASEEARRFFGVDDLVHGAIL